MNTNIKDVFLSHASKDKEEYVKPFAQKLDAESITYWLDEAEITWGDKIGKKINDGLSKSRFIILFLSQNFLGRNWPETELSAAITKENKAGATVVLPLIIGKPDEILTECPLIQDKAYVCWDSGVDEIVCTLKSLLSRSENVGVETIELQKKKKESPAPQVLSDEQINDLIKYYRNELSRYIHSNDYSSAKDVFNKIQNTNDDRFLELILEYIDNSCSIHFEETQGGDEHYDWYEYPIMDAANKTFASIADSKHVHLLLPLIEKNKGRSLDAGSYHTIFHTESGPSPYSRNDSIDVAEKIRELAEFIEKKKF